MHEPQPHVEPSEDLNPPTLEEPTAEAGTPLVFPGTDSNEPASTTARDEPSSMPVEPKTSGRSKTRGRYTPRLAIRWETRFKLAIVLSFVILVSVLIANKVRQNKSIGEAETSAKGAPDLKIAANTTSTGSKRPQEPSGNKNSPKPTPAPALSTKPAPSQSLEPSPGKEATSPPPPPPTTVAEAPTLPTNPNPDTDAPPTPTEIAASNIPAEPIRQTVGSVEPPPPVEVEESTANDAGALLALAQPLTDDSNEPPPPSPAVEGSPPSSVPLELPASGMANETPAQSPGPESHLPSPAATTSQEIAPPESPTASVESTLGPSSAPPADAATAPEATPVGEPSQVPSVPSGEPPVEPAPPPTVATSPEVSMPPETVARAPAAPPTTPTPIKVSPEGIRFSTPPATSESPAQTMPEPPAETIAAQADVPPPTSSTLNAEPSSPQSPKPEPDPARPAQRSDDLVVGGAIQPVVHVVRRGENFYTISKYYYGSGRFYRALWKANSRQVPVIDELYVGSSILVPAPEDLDKAFIDPPKPSRRAAVGSSAVDRRSRAFRDSQTARATDRRVPTEEIELILPVGKSTAELQRLPEVRDDLSLDDERSVRPRRRVHVVQPHETLRSIANKELGDSHLEEELYRLNADQIDDAANLPVGLRLRLPEDTRRR